MNINQYQPIVLGFSAMVLASAVSLPAQAVNILQNGNLIPSQAIQDASPNNTYRFNGGYYTIEIPGWNIDNKSYAAITPPGTAVGSGSAPGLPGAFGYNVAPGQTVNSPTGAPAWFFNLDGDTQYGATLSQQLTGLTVGKEYVISFYQTAASINDWVNYNTPTWNQLRVSFGNGQALAPRIDMALHENVKPWQQVTMRFTAQYTSQLLSFVNEGGPGGQPPIALLTSVTVDDGTPPPTAVPWETDALPLVGATMVFGAGVFVKRKIAQGKIKNLNFEP